jgi:hypothetical protein
MTVSPVPLRIAGPGETVGYEKDLRPVLAGGFSLPARGGCGSGHSFLTGRRRRTGARGSPQSPQESTRVWTGSMPMASVFPARSPRIHQFRAREKRVVRRPLPLKTSGERGSRRRLKPSHPVRRLRCRWHRHPSPVRLRIADTPLAKIFSSRTERYHGHLQPAFYREPQRGPIMGIGFARFLRNSGRKGRANAHRGFDASANPRPWMCARGFSPGIEARLPGILY